MQIGGAGYSSNLDALALLRKKNELQKTENQESDNQLEEEKSVSDQSELSASEEQLIAKLQARDTEVKAHEAAHIAAGSGVVSGGASFTYQTGPDGKQYAIGGEVPISVPESDDPDEMIANAQKVRGAALAPADPSPQDMRVASSASMMEARARAQKAKEESQAPQDANNPDYQKALQAYQEP